MRGHSEFVTAIAFAADGGRILTGSTDKTAILWDAKTGENLKTLRGHSDWVNGAAFGADGERILTGSRDGTAILWDAESGKMLLRLYSLNNGKDWLAVTPEGYFDGSPGGCELIRHRNPQTNDLHPSEVSKRFHRPERLRKAIERYSCSESER